MTIISPRHSFVKFDGSLNDFVLPMYDKVDIAFQFLFPVDSGISVHTPVNIAVVNLQNQIIFQNDLFYAKNVCSWGRITGVSFPMHIESGQSIPAGTYNSLSELLTALKSIGLNAVAEDFLQCCADWFEDITFMYNDGAEGKINFYRGVQQVTLNRSFAAGISVQLQQCFKLAIIAGTSSDISYSNIFKRVADDKYLTQVTYNGNENCYSFYYPSEDVINKILLPVFVRFPKYPESRKIYIKSNKQYKVLSANIEKEWELVSEHLPAFIHEKVAVMLAHDNINFVSDFISSDVFKKDEYTIDWQERISTAQAKCKILQPFEGRNSNCEKRRPCCAPVVLPGIVFPDGVINQAYSYSITLTGNAPFGFFNFVHPAWMDITVNVNQITFSGTPTEEAENVTVSGSISNCTGANVVSFSDTINVAGLPQPSITQTSNSGTPGGTRTQTFDVGFSVQPGNKFMLIVYSHDVIVIAVLGDTRTSIAAKLATALNNTTPTQWNSSGTAPSSGTPGFPPTATSSGNIVTVTLNYGNQFASSASIN